MPLTGRKIDGYVWSTRAGQIMSAEMLIMGTSHRGVISQATIETFEVEIKGTYHLMKKCTESANEIIKHTFWVQMTIR